MFRPMPIIDTETGGLKKQHPTIQLGACVTDGINEIASFNAYLQFNEADCDPDALKKNNYDPELWRREAEPAAEAVERFSRWLNPYKCVPMVSERTQKPYSVARLGGYNALTFDGPRLDELYAGQFKPFLLALYDVRQLIAWYFEVFPSEERPKTMQLQDVCDFFGIPEYKAHCALGDSRRCAALRDYVVSLTRCPELMGAKYLT